MATDPIGLWGSDVFGTGRWGFFDSLRDPGGAWLSAAIQSFQQQLMELGLGNDPVRQGLYDYLAGDDGPETSMGEFNLFPEMLADSKKKCQTYFVPRNVQAAALKKLGWTLVSVTLTPDNKIAEMEMANLAFKALPSGLSLPADSRMTISGIPGGFQISVSGGTTPGSGYLSLPTNSWFAAGISYAQFSKGQFTRVNGQAAGISGTSLLGSILGVNSMISRSLNSNGDAVSGATALSAIMSTCP